MCLFALFFSFVRSIIINLRLLPIRQAVRLPILVRYDTKIKGKGKIILKNDKFIKPAIIRIGFHRIPTKHDAKVVIENNGVVIVEGGQHIGAGTIIFVAKGAELILGDNFAISGHSTISCNKRISFGRDIQLSWDCLIMDSDTHDIYGENGTRINEDKEIIFGDKIWMGCRSIVLKGAVIPNNCVIGSSSLVTGRAFEQSSIIAGSPAKSIKKISGFKI